MPQNPATGKADSCPLSTADFREFCIKKAREKGKGHARDSPNSSEQAALLSTHLNGLRMLNLDSSSSYATTPADSPATLPQLALQEYPAPSPPPAPKAATTTMSSAGKSAFKALAAAPILYLTGALQLLKPACWQAMHSCSDVSPVSDDGSNGARITAMESRLDKIEADMCRWADGFDIRLEQLGM
jgi:hypothetical protein